MRNRALLATTVALTLTALPASADPTPTPTPTSTLAPMDQYKADMAKFQELVKQREIAVRAIHTTFAVAVEKANKDYRIAMQSAKGADLKYQAKVALKVAIQAAADAYDQSIAALGPAPTPPVKPMAANRIAPNKDNKRRN